MALKTLGRKAKVGVKVLHDEGVLGFTILTLRFVEKNLAKRTRQERKHPIGVKAKYEDVLLADFTCKRHSWKGTDVKTLHFNWLMPPPGRGSGGHFTIFRFIKYLEEAGHVCHIYIYTEHKPGRVSDIQNLMGDSFPKVRAEMEWIENGNQIPDAHGLFATSWETAYAAFNSKAKGKRFYFVQDFEPFFYPIGSLYVLAENTYKFGFHGITAGKWLAKKLHESYGMQTDYFDFGSDSTIYTSTNKTPRKEILFYARPYTERRGFELGVLALDLFHKAHPDYTINFLGWDVSDYDIPFPYKNLGVLEHAELNELYNRCAAGLVLSLTNMSLLPLELLSSGCIPVVNDGENNRLVSNNPYIEFTNNDPASLAAALSRVVKKEGLREYAKAGAASVKNESWEKAGKRFLSIVESQVRNTENKSRGHDKIKKT